MIGQRAPTITPPGEAWGGLTRVAVGVNGANQPARLLDQHIVAPSGVWLPSSGASTHDLAKLSDYRDSNPGKTQDRGGDPGLDSIEVSGPEACWRSEQDICLAAVTKLAIGNDILESPPDFDVIRACSSQDCLYHRHYDITLGLPSGNKELLSPYMGLYRTVDDGSILTGWGDRLPSFAKSAEALQAFRRRCMPHVSREKSLLTAGNIGFISLVDRTGCWMTRNYHMAAVQYTANGWRKDSYGRLSIPKAISDNYGGFEGVRVGHRTVWSLHNKRLYSQATGFVLNHNCAFKPCCNPGHLSQVKASKNVHHGHMCDTATQMHLGITSIDQGVEILGRQRRNVPGITMSDIELFWREHEAEGIAA